MRKTILIAVLVLLPAAILGGVSLFSCSWNVTCGTGTHEESGKCLPNLPGTCGPGTVSSAGQCIKIDGPICGPNTSLDVDAGECVGTGGGSGDGGTGQLIGGRWTNVNMIKPVSIATIANLQLPPSFADGTFVIILRTENIAGTVLLHGGDGQKMSDDPLMYTFKEGFDPTPGVITTLGDSDKNDAGVSKTPFETAQNFNMRFQFVGNATDPQPPLYIWGAKITGTLNDQNVPTSNDPPLGGTLSGCFLAHGDMAHNQAGASDIYISLLSETIEELIESSGGTMDMDCNGSGSNNGYAFEIQWDSNETPLLTIDLGDAGVAHQDAQ